MPPGRVHFSPGGATHTHTHTPVLCSAAPFSLELPQLSSLYPVANVANRLLHVFSSEPFLPSWLFCPSSKR